MIELLEQIEKDLESQYDNSEVLSLSFQIVDGELKGKGHITVNDEDEDSPHNASYETVEFPVEDLYDVSKIRSAITSSKVNNMLKGFDDVDSPTLKYQPDKPYTGDRLGIYIRHTLEYDEIILDEDIITELCDEIAKQEGCPVDDSSRIAVIEVDSPETDENPPRGLSPDSTILYTTDEPHAMWANCDTLEDYAEMIAKDNDEYTKQDILNKDTYKSHFHLSGSSAPVSTFRKVATEIKSTLNVDEQVKISRYRIDQENDSMEIVMFASENLD